MPTHSSKKGKSGKAPRSSTKGRKYVRFNIPFGEVAAIQKAWIEGVGDDNTITALAKKFGRDRETVSAIVHCPKMEEVAVQMQKKLLITTADKVTNRIELEVMNPYSDKGADIAMDLAERWGAIPPKIRIIAGAFRRADEPQTADKEKPEHERVKDIVMQLTEIAMERGSVFGMPMPEIEEAREEIRIPLHVKKEQVE